MRQLLLSFVHRCAAGFLGDYCHHKDPCHPGYCLNGGNCSVAVSGIPGSPTCSCPLGYTGQHCQTPQNSTCYPNNPCANQGVCTLLSLDKYKCQCAHGWTGQLLSDSKVLLYSPFLTSPVQFTSPNPNTLFPRFVICLVHVFRTVLSLCFDQNSVLYVVVMIRNQGYKDMRLCFPYFSVI